MIGRPAERGSDVVLLAVESLEPGDVVAGVERGLCLLGEVASCSPLWTGTTGSLIRSSPAVANGVVYVGSSDGNLYAFPASCGTGGASCTPLWTATTANAIDSSPAVANGVIYVGSLDSNLYAYDLNPANAAAKTARPNAATLKPNNNLKAQ